MGERGDQEHVHGAGRDDRHRGGQQGAQPGETPLRQDHHHDRCRRRRQPHRDADADVLLPQDEGADRERPRLHRHTAPLSGEKGQAGALLLDREGARYHLGRIRQGRAHRGRFP